MLNRLCHMNVPWAQELCETVAAAHSSGLSKMPRFVLCLQIRSGTAHGTAVFRGPSSGGGGETPVW